MNSVSCTGPDLIDVRGEFMNQLAIDLVYAVPDTLKHGNVGCKYGRQARNGMAAAPQLVFIIPVRFETRNADQIPSGEMRQAGQIICAHRKPEFASFEQFARKLRPAVLRQLIGADGFIGDVGRRPDLFGCDSWDSPFSTPHSEEKHSESGKRDRKQ